MGPSTVLAALDASDLSLALCGPSTIDVADWEGNCEYLGFRDQESHNHTKTWFWQAIREMSDPDRQRFLQFATGQAVPPPGICSWISRQSIYHLCSGQWESGYF